MRITYFKEHSKILGFDMEYKVYGHAGKACLVFPCQNGRFYEWEDRGMFSLLEPWIDAGQIQFVCVDSIDEQSWSNAGNIRHRMYMQEQWVQYIMQELIPSFPEQKWMATGCSMGGFHATNLYLRFPDTFDQLLSLSGVFDMEPFFAFQETDFNCYQNNPCDYVRNMDPFHPYISKYNQNQAVFVVGQGDWEHQCLADLRKLMNELMDKGIQAEYHFYSSQYPHDWPSWETYVVEYLPKMIKK